MIVSGKQKDITCSSSFGLKARIPRTDNLSMDAMVFIYYTSFSKSTGVILECADVGLEIDVSGDTVVVANAALCNKCWH